MIKKVKKIILFTLTAACSLPLAALDFSVNMEPFWSVTGGSIREYVWTQSPGGAYDYKLSELLWDLKPLWAGGIKVSALLEGFELSGSFAFGLTGKSGSMQDSDWLNDVPAQKTNYSKSPNLLSGYMDVSGAFGYNFKLPKGWSISPFLSFVYRSISFDAVGGTYDYPEDFGLPGVNPPFTEVGSETDRSKGAFPDDDVISYEQYVQYFSLGAKASYTLGSKWKFSGSVSFIPLIFATGYDNHWLTFTEYLDVMFGGLGVSGFLRADFVLDKSVSIGIGANMEYIGNLKGSDIKQSTLYTNAAYDRLRNSRKNPLLCLIKTNKALANGSILASNAKGGAGQFLFGATFSVRLSF